MTRTQLRKILVNDVKLDYDFVIYRCEDKNAMIKVFLSRDKYKDELNYRKVKKIMDPYTKNFRKNGFLLTHVDIGVIEFQYPKKYQSDKKLEESWKDDLVTSRPIWEVTTKT